jgi:hypothetical protein
MKPIALAACSLATIFVLALLIFARPDVSSAQAPLPAPSAPGGDAGLLGATMTITQTLSDEAQRNTIAFSGLAFLTGSLGADSFFPPGKVADFWGFQYLRDNDPSAMGHNPLFLTSAAFNMWSVLTTAQRAQLKALATSQVSAIDDYAYRRFVLMKAFRRLQEGTVPTGSAGLDIDAVKAYSAELYRLDGQISYDRAQVMGAIIASLSAEQKLWLQTNMLGKGMLAWPAVSEPADMQGLDRAVKEALMTYAGDIYSWYAGSLDADVYFCPERQGTYFGSFYLKDTPVMSAGGSIDPNLTATAGITFQLTLDSTQLALVTGLVDTQRTSLSVIVERRRDIATQLRRFMLGETPDLTTVLDLASQYGELDGAIIYHYATNFTQVGALLSTSQQAELDALRARMLGEFPLIPDPKAYRYADQIDMPTIVDTDFLFLASGSQMQIYLPLIMSVGSSSTTLRLPDTGQVASYTATVGEDADYSLNPPAYTANGDGTVSDQVTGMIWQQADGGEMTFPAAATYCADLTLGGQSDWQLPSSAALFNLVSLDRNPAMNPAFTASAAQYWWSANELSGDSSRAWVVNAGGGVGAHPKSETLSAGGAKRFHTRCVRNVPASTASQLTAGSGMVSDATNGLVWQQAEGGSMAWEAALSYCEGLSLGGRTDWRLPNSKELRSISSDTLVNPSLSRSAFPGAQAARYWSSTTQFGHAGAAWFIDFSSGLASYNDKTGLLAVRCVRGG